MKIGPYEVVSELGRGGMGRVFLARSPSGEELAVKVLDGAGPNAFTRFDRERRLLSVLGEEDGFVSLRDAGIADGGAWIAMPFVPGGTLRSRLDRGPLGIAETIALGRALAEALGKAHERGIVHRDLKPENVLFTAGGRPLVADLGLAKHFDPLARGASQSVALSTDGGLKGTAGYMAPEQVVDAKNAGPAADVFALGAVVHECLAGLPAFPGETALEVLSRLASGKVAPLGRTDVPRWLEEIVARALAPDPCDRFPDGASLARALASQSPAGRSASSRLALVLLVASLLVAGALAALVAGPRPPEPPRAPPPPRVSAPTSDELARTASAKVGEGDFRAAMLLARRALDLDPRNVRAWVALGQAVTVVEGTDAARAVYDRALELEPRSGLLHASRGAGNVLQDFDGAVAEVNQAVELAPDDAEVRLFRAGTFRWRWQTPGYLESIKDDASRAIELDPGRGSAWNMRGFARGQLGDLEGARADLEKAVELDRRENVGWLLDLGNVDMALRRPAEAAVAFDRAARADPGDPHVQLGLGAARLSLGEWDAATRALERCIELAPGDPGAAEARRLLAQAKARAR